MCFEGDCLRKLDEVWTGRVSPVEVVPPNKVVLAPLETGDLLVEVPMPKKKAEPPNSCLEGEKPEDGIRPAVLWLFWPMLWN